MTLSFSFFRRSFVLEFHSEQVSDSSCLETESRGWVPEARGWDCSLMGTEFQFASDREVLEKDGGNGCTTV